MLMIRPATIVTTVMMTAFASTIRPRRGVTVSVSRIMPLAYSEATMLTPSTTKRMVETIVPTNESSIGLNLALSASDHSRHDQPVIQDRSAVAPTERTAARASVIQVERTVTSLVHSDASVAVNGTRAVDRAPSDRVTSAVMLDMGGLLLPGTRLGDIANVRFVSIGLVFDAVAGQLHEGRLQAGPARRELVQRDAMHRRQLPDAGRVHARH